MRCSATDIRCACVCVCVCVCVRACARESYDITDYHPKPDLVYLFPHFLPV